MLILAFSLLFFTSDTSNLELLILNAKMIIRKKKRNGKSELLRCNLF